MSFRNGPLVLNTISEQRKDLFKSFPGLCFFSCFLISAFMMLDLGIGIFNGMALRFCHQMKESLRKMSSVVKKRGRKAYVR